MKKNHKSKKRFSPSLIGASKFNPFFAILVVGVTAITGIAVLRAGLAAGTGTVYVSVYQLNSNGSQLALAGANVSISSAASGSSCPVMSGTTASNGRVAFGGCVSYPPGVYFVKVVSLSGYHVDPSTPPNNNLTFADGSKAVAIVYMRANDTDGDGVPDISDACPTRPGLASNKGCPLAAPAPAPATPPTPTSTPTPAPAPQTNSTPSTSPTPNAPPASARKIAPTPATPPPPAPAIAAATSGDTSPPNKPQALNLTLDGTTALLGWNTASDNVGVVSYSVERSVDQAKWDSIAPKLSDTAYEDKDLQTSKHYYYRVRAADASGNQSEAVFADIEVPGVSDQAKAKAQSGNGAKSLLVVGGSLLLLLAGGGGLWFWRMKRFGPQAYDDQTTTQAVEDVTHPQVQTAEHTSESLKDMVLEDYHPKNPKS